RFYRVVLLRGRSGPPPRRLGEVAELAEVPAGDLLRDDAQPGVTAVVSEVLGSGVLLGHQPFRLGELAGFRGLGFRALARNRADHGSLTLDLDPVQFGVVVAVVDDHRDLGGALQVGPALAAGQGVNPQGSPVPDEPDRRDVRSARAERGEPAGALLGQERVQLTGAHGDGPATPLLPGHSYLALPGRAHDHEDFATP